MQLKLAASTEEEFGEVQDEKKLSGMWDFWLWHLVCRESLSLSLAWHPFEKQGKEENSFNLIVMLCKAMEETHKHFLLSSFKREKPFFVVGEVGVSFLLREGLHCQAFLLSVWGIPWHSLSCSSSFEMFFMHQMFLLIYIFLRELLSWFLLSLFYFLFSFRSLQDWFGTHFAPQFFFLLVMLFFHFLSFTVDTAFTYKTLFSSASSLVFFITSLCLEFVVLKRKRATGTPLKLWSKQWYRRRNPSAWMLRKWNTSFLCWVSSHELFSKRSLLCFNFFFLWEDSSTSFPSLIL